MNVVAIPVRLKNTITTSELRYFDYFFPEIKQRKMSIYFEKKNFIRCTIYTKLDTIIKVNIRGFFTAIM